ncbi:hypothetical protein AHAS_Ahas15G0274000 [Arachis hypogaea]
MESSSRASARFIPEATVKPITLSRKEILEVTLKLRLPLLPYLIPPSHLMQTLPRSPPYPFRWHGHLPHRVSSSNALSRSLLLSFSLSLVSNI